MNVNESPDNELPEDLPPEIAAVLAEDTKVEPFISRQRDQAILAAARAELGSSKIVRPQFRPGRWLAAAAAIAICFAVFQQPQQSPKPQMESPPADFNRDSAVDILDVMYLAQRIESDSDVPASGDFNNDGVIDEADVDAFAAALVQLENPI